MMTGERKNHRSPRQKTGTEIDRKIAPITSNSCVSPSPFIEVRPVFGDGSYEQHYHYCTRSRNDSLTSKTASHPRTTPLLLKRLLIHLLGVPPGGTLKALKESASA
ncbi:hypothetical protein AVEN_192912-1 [Araneus ventricosus]|uniref:Uncharacterized protein n=1 Tax=Araneus ventricosus TaxID=182803 RepID=A0A4Y2JMK2_ARAVE|nr:hypothetical protein AVEN_192912-1 [Araneus ventricosus]